MTEILFAFRILACPAFSIIVVDCNEETIIHDVGLVNFQTRYISR